jgi:hypothetical protein
MIHTIFLFNIRNIFIFIFIPVRYPIRIEYPSNIRYYPYLNSYPKNYNEYKYNKNIIHVYLIRLHPISLPLLASHFFIVFVNLTLSVGQDRTQYEINPTPSAIDFLLRSCQRSLAVGPT